MLGFFWFFVGFFVFLFFCFFLNALISDLEKISAKIVQLFPK